MTRRPWRSGSGILCLLALAAAFSLGIGRGGSLVRMAAATPARQLGTAAGAAQDVQSSGSCTVGPPYTSYTGTDAIGNPSSPPPMGPAGSKIYETEFPVQNQIVRVTDERTAQLLGQPQGDFSVVGAALTNRWSSDDTHFVVWYSNRGYYFIYNFDPNCADGSNYMNVAPDKFNNNSALSPFFNPVFNAVESNIIAYGTFQSQFQTCTHDHAAGTCAPSVMFDVGADPNIPPLYKGGLSGLSATRDADGNIAVAATVNFRPEPPGCTSNCTGQDKWDGVVVCVRNYDGGGHSGCVYWDSYLGNLGGDFGPQCTACLGVPQGMLLHDAKINAREDGQLSDLWLEGTAQMSDPTHGNQFWNVGSATFIQFLLAPDGHGVMGNNFYVNNSNGFNKDSRSWLVRPLALLSVPLELIPNPPPPQLLAQDMHPGVSNSLQYVYNGLFQARGGNCRETTAWECENIAVQAFPPLPGVQNATVWRFVHNWSFNTGLFTHVPHGEVSPDGKFMCFGTDWGKTLAHGRADAFCHEMK